MRQWEDDTLVATKITESGKFKVIELPARETEVITSRRTFGTIAKAEAYMLDQYPTATVVFPSDIEAWYFTRICAHRDLKLCSLYAKV